MSKVTQNEKLAADIDEVIDHLWAIKEVFDRDPDFMSVHIGYSKREHPELAFYDGADIVYEQDEPSACEGIRIRYTDYRNCRIADYYKEETNA